MSEESKESKQDEADPTDPYNTLAAVDVSQFVESKNGRNFLSWTYAAHELLTRFPHAKLEVMTNEQGHPFHKTELGYFVHCRVTIEGVPREQWYPVWDNRYRTIAKPGLEDINKSIMRGMTKTIALHGLGLNVYAGEDLPMAYEEEGEAGATGATKATQDQQKATPPVPVVPPKAATRADRSKQKQEPDADQFKEIYKEIWEISQGAGMDVEKLRRKCQRMFKTNNIKELNKVQLDKLRTAVRIDKSSLDAGWSQGFLQNKSEDLFETRDLHQLDQLQLDQLSELVGLAAQEQQQELALTGTGLERATAAPQIGIVDDRKGG